MRQGQAPARGTVYIIDDDAVVLTSLSRLIQTSGYDTRCFGSAMEFLNHIAEDRRLGCAIVDLRMPGMDGLELQRQLLRTGVSLPLIFLTGHADIPSTVEAVKKGAVDYLTKPVASETLFPAIEAALQLHARALADASEMGEYRKLFETLTPREREVCLHVSTGSLNKQVGASLGISERTVKIHRARGMRKLKVQSVAELVRMIDRLQLKNAVSDE
ncbi:MAG: response regulator transcription factor [Bryobacterales bacterium]|nr:response regulator transcription factor [Bryobacterales bacterium]